LRRRIGPLAALFTITGLLVAAIVIVPASPASAYRTLGCKNRSTTVRWLDQTGGGTYGAVADDSVFAWTVTPTPIGFTRVTSGYHATIRQGNFGNVGYDGITQRTTGGNPTCSNGVWSTALTAWWNTHYTNGYSALKRQSVMVHELGHVLGLAHSGSGGCGTVPIMHPTTQRRFDECHLFSPTTDDVNGVNFIY
jgi:hypothetical protein